ncbi:MAG: ATP synthase d subunit [Cyphobasidiales sp. Tagirdzhanova-0007]|nr:MAG: ATP synthase d subunit [Cyphobasidiales sp. Tagirdzhanova-0007]
MAVTAALHNKTVSEEAKGRVIEKLDKLGYDVDDDGQVEKHHPNFDGNGHHGTEGSHSRSTTDSSTDTTEEHSHRVLGGYKATLNNEHASEAAKEHAKDVLENNKLERSIAELTVLFRLLTTAGGSQTAEHLIPFLLQDKIDFKLFVHSNASAARIRKRFGSSIEDGQFVYGDFFERKSLTSAMKGVSKVVHVGPPYHPEEDATGKLAIEEARRKLSVEEYLMEGDAYPMHWTILQPTCFMQNIPLEKVAETGTLSLGYDVGLLQGFVDRDDLAKIISIVLKDPETHHRARYEILGVNNTHEEVANYVGKRLGKEIKAKKIGLDKFVQAAKEGGRPAPQGSYGLEANKQMLFHYDSHGLTGNSNIATWLLGHKPTDWPAYLEKNLQTLSALQAFRKRNADAKIANRAAKDQPDEVDFARYKGLLKNQKVVDELEQTFKSFKPVDYDVAAQIKAIDAFQEKAVDSAKKAAQKVDSELSSLQAALKDIESARPFEDLTTADVAKARPQVTHAVEELVRNGRATVPGYESKFGNLQAI